MNFWSIFAAALRSVGIAGTMAFGGFYLHRRKLVTSDGTKMLAVLTRQVTIPALLFSKVVMCRKDPEDRSEQMGGEGQGSGSCGSVTDDMGDIWVLLLCPFFVIGCGLLVGYVAAEFSNLPRSQLPISLVACSLNNANALPIVLLTVIHENPPTPQLGKIDPIMFLSIYLLPFPILLWGIGGWLLGSGDSPLKDENRLKERARIVASNDESSQLLETGPAKSFGITSASSSSLVSWTSSRKVSSEFVTDLDKNSVGLDYAVDDVVSAGYDAAGKDESTPVDDMVSNPNDMESVPMAKTGPESYLESPGSLHRLTDKNCESHDGSDNAATNTKAVSFHMENVRRFCGIVFQAPVVVSLLGLVIASIRPLRAVFVDAYGLGQDAPLQWVFDAIYSVGQAAVPVNMTLLGIHLSKTLQSSGGDSDDVARKKILSTRTTAAIVIGKMVVMPLVGALTVLLVKNYLWHIPQTIASSFYLVLLIEFITPTATNVMVIVELSGSGSQESMARLIGWQYAFAPVLLSLSVAMAVIVASH